MIAINFILNRRFRYIFCQLAELKKIPKELKDQIYINLFFTNQEIDIGTLKDFAGDLDVRVHHNTGGNYMNKIYKCFSFPSEYCVKIDEDVFIPANLWGYMISRRNILDDLENLFVAPLLSTGIPTAEIFIENFCEEKDKLYLFNMFNEYIFPAALWGCDYSSLNIGKKSHWNPEEYYEKVSKINHFY